MKSTIYTYRYISPSPANVTQETTASRDYFFRPAEISFKGLAEWAEIPDVGTSPVA